VAVAVTVSPVGDAVTATMPTAGSWPSWAPEPERLGPAPTSPLAQPVVDVLREVADATNGRHRFGAAWLRSLTLGMLDPVALEHRDVERALVDAVRAPRTTPCLVGMVSGKGGGVNAALMAERRSVCLTREGAGLVSVGHIMAGFVDVLGAGARPERLVPLHDEDVALRLDDDLAVDADGLRTAVGQPRVSARSGGRFGGQEPFDELMLWLATVFDDFALLTHNRSAMARALVDPASPIGTPTVVDGASVAYLTYRKVEAEDDMYEFGAHGHGPVGAVLAEAVCEQVRVWDREHRGGPPARITVLPADAPADRLPEGRIVPKRHTTIVISWPTAADARQ